ncbi:exo-beta-1,3-glucanase (GH17 family) [Plasticicumulans lactativorans]|uniref:Endo-1,3-beta-glucanase btgC n=1 Tax=Plasticicumulans lactativorans TaxID=1133106 RepID=A0A4R2KYQ9_9GAMM|nr:hypothetical protein [Plasticicumulans lactativorans]TCO79224.1 exo-beta-1,3-glucanase (GH17 family) [Plasticicumulans lactativorans]
MPALLRLLLLVLTFACAAPAAAADLTRLRAALATVRFIAYTPSAHAETPDGRPLPVAPAAIRADLARLRPDFDGLVTYATRDGLEALPALAAEQGFRALVLGVWEPNDPHELDAAIAAARAYPGLVVGISVGNEGLISGRYDWPTLAAALQRVRTALPGLPLSTSEPFVIHLDRAPAGFLAAQDFVHPNIHPLFEAWFTPERLDGGMDFLAAILDRLHAAAPGKPVLVKETGVPGEPGGVWSPALQAAFWQRLYARFPGTPEHAFTAFEAFDAPWKPAALARQFKAPPDPREAHWGFYTRDGTPKPVVERLRAPR